MTQAQVLRPKDLSPQDAADWRALAAAEPAFYSPLVSPEFAQAVGQVRDDARVAVWRRDGRAIGFLAFHKRPGAFARPIGAPISDYHALVCGPDFGLTGPEALGLAGLGAYRFTGLVDPYGLFGTPVETAESHVIRLDRPADGYMEALRAASAKKFKNWRRLDHKLEREYGAVRVAAPDHDRETFQTLIDWKRDQLRRTGGHDFLGTDWTQELLNTLFEMRTGQVQGLMIGLYADGQLVAGHFGVRRGDAYHPWLAAANPEMAQISPGQVFILRAIAEMDQLGLTTYDLGPGHDHYKRAFASQQVIIGAGLATAPNSAGKRALQVDKVWTLAGARRRSGLAGRLHRRLEVIAAAETTLIGRTRSFAHALAGQARRRHAGGEEA
jgi:CelD/BcsL family acetyltransferase involved in cellulose biosynthesis